MLRRLTCATLTTMLFAAVGGTASAGIISIAGQVVNDGQLVSQNLSKDALVSDNLNVAHLFTEQQAVQVATDVTLDLTNTGLVTAPSGAIPGVLSAGTLFDSYFLHYDIFQNGFGIATGSITFGSAIIGLQFRDRTLDKAHAVVGQAGVTYQTSSKLDGTLDSSAQDFVQISANRRTLTFQLAVQPHVDTLRIFTEVAEVPEPGSMLLFGLGMAGVAGAKLRSRSRRETSSG